MVHNLLLFNRWRWLSVQNVCFACKLNFISDTNGMGLHLKIIISDNAKREREGEIDRKKEMEREWLRNDKTPWTTATAKDVRHNNVSLHDERALQENSCGTRIRIVRHRDGWLQYPRANSKFNTASARGRAGSSPEFAHILIETIDGSWRHATWAAHPNNEVSMYCKQHNLRQKV